MLLPGDPAPRFITPSSINPKFHFDSAAGRRIVLCFFESSAGPFSAKLIEEVNRRQDRFDVTRTVFFGVSIDPKDRDRLKQQWPGVIYFWDDDKSISRSFGAMDVPGPDGV